MSQLTLLGKYVLVADDIRAMRAIVRSLLHPFKPADILEADDGQQALQILRSRRIDLVITDLNMSPINGIELTQEIRSPRSGLDSTIPVLMISGHRSGAEIKAAIAAGVSEFLMKPLVPADFSMRLKSLYSRARTQVESPTYKGPDRRRRDLWVRHDRRHSSKIE